jgi:PKD repeat protein
LWTKIAGPTTGVISNANAANTSITGLVQGTYRFELRVTDNSGASDTDTVQVIVNAAPNQAPTANAGADVTITLPNNTVVLNGSATDNDGSIVGYSWIKVTGPQTGSLTNSNTANATVNFVEEGIYVYRLTVTDNAGATGSDLVQINVLAAPNVAPLVNAGSNVNIYLPVNSVQLNAVATDPDGIIQSYSWSVINGPAQFVFTSTSTAQTTFQNLSQGVYEVQVKVTDNKGGIGLDTVVVSVGASKTVVLNQNKVRVYPNPVQDVMNIEISSLKNRSKVRLLLYDSKGMLVLQKLLLLQSSVHVETIGVSNLTAGLYIVHLVFDDKSKITQQISKL